MFPTVHLFLSAALTQATALAGYSPAATTKPQVQAVRLSQPIILDGKLEEAVWQGDHAVVQFIQRDPHEGAPASERTQVYLAYDDEAVYIAARMHDSAPDSIVARLARRDVAISADRFMVFLDPYHDRRTGFYFGVNAAGTLYDGIMENDDWDNDSWDGVWEAQTHRDAEGWTVEMRIPYSQLRFQRGARYLWGVNFKREIARKNEMDYLAYTPKNGSGFVSRFPDLIGIDSVTPPRRLEVLPYLSSKAELLDHEAGDPFNDGSRFRGGAGADLKFGLGSNLTLDATLNPDFGQVEVDPAVVNLSDVETFYPEKRPFFIEGASIFNFGFGGANNYWSFNWPNPDFFYSRRIGRQPQGSTPDVAYDKVPDGTTILGAAKLSGKVGKGLSVGALHAITDRETADLADAGHKWKTEVEPLTYYGVYRGQKEFGEGRRALGIISTVTARSFGDPRLRAELNSSAFAFGTDGWTFLDKNRMWVLTGWAGLSHVRGSVAQITGLQRNSVHYFQRPDAQHVEVDSSATSLSGYAGRLFLNKQRGDWRLNANVGVIDPGFEVNDLGFQSRSDQINTHVGGSRRWMTPSRILRQTVLNAAIFRTWDYSGNLTWSGYFLSGFTQFLNYYSVDWFFAYNPETVSNRRTRGGPLTLNPRGWEGNLLVESDRRDALVFGAGLHGNFYQEGSENSWSVNTSLEWKPASAVSFRLQPEFERIRIGAQYVGTFDDATATSTFGQRYVFGALDQTTLSASLRLNWIFTPKLSLELYAQPLPASAKYPAFKQLSRPSSYAFDRLGDGRSTIQEVRDQDGTVAEYVVDPDGPGPAAEFRFENPAFSDVSLRGNAVLRWEYLPGSTLFLIWTQSRFDSETLGDFQFQRSLSRLFDAKADNILAMKVTYWWNP